MATGNFFLGTARRSVGDVTFYVSRGEQRSRVRRRVIANPRTTRQLVQRSVVANISRLYSLGQEIFNHAFQGYNTPYDNQVRFNKVNVSRLRALMLQDIEADRDWDLCTARIGARGISVAVPFIGLQVSEGGYAQTAFTFSESDNMFRLPAPTTGEKIKDFAARVGLIPGDIYTIVAFFVSSIESDPVAIYSRVVPAYPGQCLYPCTFDYAQIEVKASVTTDETVIDANTLMSALFDAAHALNFSTAALGDGLDFAYTPLSNSIPQTMGGQALIRSRYGEDLRSTSYLVPTSTDTQTNPYYKGMRYGLTFAELQEAWGNTGPVATPDKILTGEDF